jgi:hypothetical protein
MIPNPILPLAVAILALFTTALPQPTQISVTNPAADAVLKGKYNPSQYQAGAVIDQIGVIMPDLAARISTDSVTATLTHLTTFYNRNTGSDTVSSTQGIGAARRWVYSKFQAISSQNGGRLLPSYLQFTQAICAANSHRDVFAVLPGRDTANPAVFIIESHLDSRCENSCDIACKANGADDNGSGVAATVELARVLSKYTFNHTLVFLANTGEEQSLAGSGAFAQYCQTNNVPVKGVENDDIVSGIICGPKSSPPGCTQIGGKDSVDVRIFSTALNFSMNKAFARFIKGQYDQWLKPTAKIPMNIEIMDPTDRTGRGGDHEPFSRINIPAIRFTSAFENGDGTPTGGRQHTTLDVVGDDRNGDGALDTFYVNWEYMARNALINGAGLVSAGLNPEPPNFSLAETAQHFIQVTVTLPSSPVGVYRVALRDSGNNDFAVAYTLKDSVTFIVPATQAGKTYFIALASLDGNGDQSLYSQEQQIKATANGPPLAALSPRRVSGNSPARLLAPIVAADRITLIVQGNPAQNGEAAVLKICDSQGRNIRIHRFRFAGPEYEVTLARSQLAPGLYTVSLLAHGKILSGQRLVLTRR